MKNQIKQKEKNRNIDSLNECISDDKSLSIKLLLALRGGDGEGISSELILPPPPPLPPPTGN
jgi:hypothetical protein